MFAKLKQKIEEGGTDLTKEFAATQRTGGSGSPLMTRSSLSDFNTRKQYGSNESLLSDSSTQNEAVSSPSRDTFSEDLLGSPGSKSSLQRKDIELKFKELTKALRNEISKREKVERVLEKQQDLLAKRLEEKDEEWRSKLAASIKENEQLTMKLNDANMCIEKLAKNHETVEELEDFQTQEISKVKHLLLLCEQQLKVANDTVKLKESELELQSKSITDLMVLNETLQKRSYEKCNDETMHHPQGENRENAVEINKLIAEERNNYKILEKKFGDLQEVNNSLKCQNSLLQEKCALELQKDEKIQVLEQQLRQSSVTISKENETVKLRDIEIESLRSQLKTTEENFQIAKDSEFKTSDRLSQLEELVSLSSSEKERLKQLNELLSVELNQVKEDLMKTKIEFDSTVDQVKLLNDELNSAESEKQNLMDMLSEFRQSEQDVENANSEASRLERLSLSLQDQITEKNKVIKLQQQQINDMKKTLQRELKLQSNALLDTNSNDSNEKNAQVSKYPSAVIGSLQRDRPCSLSDKLDDVNFKYVKHVVLKFMTSTETEAHQLIRAIGVLLDFTREEEQLVRETLDWKTSWFGSKPQLSRIHVGNRTIVS
ncbi:hypothetical protein CHUAL_009269 [Chamberlinius hualienensis]